MNWLTPKLNNAIKNSIDQQDLSLSFDVEHFTIVYSYTPIDEYGNELDKDGNIGDDGDHIEFVEKLSKKDFILYLAKLFYYFPAVEIINMNMMRMIRIILMMFFYLIQHYLTNQKL